MDYFKKMVEESIIDITREAVNSDNLNIVDSNLKNMYNYGFPVDINTLFEEYLQTLNYLKSNYILCNYINTFFNRYNEIEQTYKNLYHTHPDKTTREIIISRWKQFKYNANIIN